MSTPISYALPVIPPSYSEAKHGGASSRGSHRLAAISICERQWFFHEVWKINPSEEPEYRIGGTLIHLVLAYLAASALPVKPKWYTERTLEQALYEDGEGYPEAVDLAKNVLQVYMAKGFDQTGQPVAVEHEFAATVKEIRHALGCVECRQAGAPGGMKDACVAPRDADGQVVTSRIDRLDLRNGQLWCVDYKSTGYGKTQYLSKFNLKGEYGMPWQFLLQTGILRSVFGEAFAGHVLLRVKRKVPYDIDENVVPMPHRPLRELSEDLRQQCLHEERLINEISAAQAAGINIWNGTWLPPGAKWSCFRWGVACDYRPLCLTDSDEQLRWVRDNEYVKIGE